MKHRTGKIRIASPEVERLARTYDEQYAQLMAEGYRFMASSGFWRTRRNGITARFVYRKGNVRAEGGRITHTTVITGIGTDG